jgi:hypothetical protein
MELRRFLPPFFKMEAAANHEVSPDSVIAAEEAATAFETATRFVA